MADSPKIIPKGWKIEQNPFFIFFKNIDFSKKIDFSKSDMLRIKSYVYVQKTFKNNSNQISLALLMV